MSSLIDTVNWYKTLSADHLVNQQKAYIPRLESEQIDYIADHYILDGKRIPVNITNQLFIKLKYLNFRKYTYRIFKDATDKYKPWDQVSTPTKKFLTYDHGVFTMQELIDNKIIEPFMLFINGWFIPWEYLSIVNADETYYLIIDTSNTTNTNSSHVERLIKACDFVQIVTLPEHCTCVTNYDNPIGAIFTFDEYGKFEVDNPKYFIISGTSGFRFNYWHSNQAINAFRILNQQDIKLTEDNIILFVNGLLGTGDRVKVPRGFEDEIRINTYYVDTKLSPYVAIMDATESPIEEGGEYLAEVSVIDAFKDTKSIKYIRVYMGGKDVSSMDTIVFSGDTGTIYIPSITGDIEIEVTTITDETGTIDYGTVFSEKDPTRVEFTATDCLTFSYSTNFINPNPEITMHSSLLTINHGVNPDVDVYDFGLFVNPEYEVNVDNISRIDLDELSPVIQNYNLTGVAPDYLESLTEPFVLQMDRSKLYPENLANALRTISQYNADLFTSIFRNTSNLIIESHDYEWLLAHTKGGAITLPISHGRAEEEYIMVLVNGRLYQYQNMVKYFANRIIIPIQGIGPDDTFELLRFKNINNFEKKVIINEDDGYINYSTDVINDKLCFFSKEYHGDTSYDFPADGCQHFEIPYRLEKNSNGFTRVIFDDPFYYGKELMMCYKDRFKWEVFTVADVNDVTNYCLDLGDKFKYCNEYHRYMVFLNNNRLSSNHFRLTLPTRPTTPFSEFKLYLTIPISEGDRIDILYTPAMFQDIIVRDTIDTSGDIIVDKKVLDYGLTTDLYMVWINGKKVAQTNISDIDATHIRVTSNEQSTSTLCITKFIPSITAIDEAFDENTALWDTITSIMTAEEINKLLGIPVNTITDTEENRYPDSASIKQIMNELIRDEFINNPSIDLSGPFVYDYLDVDTTIVSGYDSDGTARLETMDANHDENLAILDREYP